MTQVIPAARITHSAVKQTTEKGVTTFIYGSPGSWKTSWAAQWPGVVFLSIRSEGGDESLGVYPDIAKYLISKSKMPECPPVFNAEKPPVFDITCCKQLQEVVDAICKSYKTWGVCTVVVDSLTYLIDLWMDQLMKSRWKIPAWREKIEARGGELMGPPEWGMLNMYLRGIRVKLSNIKLNVIWTAIQKDIWETDPNNQARQELVACLPMIQGMTKVKLPGACNLHIFAEKKWKGHPTAIARQSVQPIFWTASNPLAKDIRHRYGFAFPQGKLVDPEFGDMPTFRAVWCELHPYIYTGQ